MSRVPRVIVDPKNPLSIVEHVGRVQRVVDGELEFGSPQNPNDPTSTTLANGTAHNGTVVNMKGSWFSANVEAADTRVDCAHNLDVPVSTVAAVNQPNVLWPIVCFEHNGTAADALSTLSCNYETTDAASITANSFPLRFYVSGARTVNAGNPLRAHIFFTARVR